MTVSVTAGIAGIKVKPMDDLVRMKTGFELITDINQEIARLCVEKNVLTSEYNAKLTEIDERLDMLRSTKAEISQEMAGIGGNQ